MTHYLQRITTEYILAEDRIRLSGQVEGGAPIVVWLTLRFLQRLLPKLLQWLEQQTPEMPRPEIVHGFAQQAAKAEMTPLPPVRAVTGSSVWLAQSVDLGRSERALCLTFRGIDGQHASLVLEAKPLRQWLSIVYEAYQKAKWPLEIWPVWLQESARTLKPDPVMLH